MRANVAAQHAILIALWHMATTGTLYEDLGGDYDPRLNPQRARTRAIRTLGIVGAGGLHAEQVPQA